LDAVEADSELIRRQKELEDAITMHASAAPAVGEAARAARCSLADFAPGIVRRPLKVR
jgi:hypothetical protein